MFNRLSIHAVWLLLMAVTLGSALLAESGQVSVLITLAVCLGITVKGCLVVDRLMELRSANRYIRFAMMLYFYLVPLLILLVYLIPDPLARMTSL